MKSNKLINAFQNFNYVKYLNSTFKIILVFFISIPSFGQSDGIEFEFNCSGTIVTVEFGQPDISGEYYAYPEGTAFDSGGTAIQMNWFVVFEQTLNQWELKGPTTQDGSGVPVAFFKNITTATFPSNDIINWTDTGAGGGFSCALINIIYTPSTGDPDNDEDGFNASVDCNDNDPEVNTEQEYFVDSDLDGFGSAVTAMVCASTPPSGYSDNDEDCNDNEPLANPGLDEIPFDTIDNDCDGEIDEDDNPPTVYEYCDDQNKKILICHNGKTKCVSINAKDAHLAHGDFLGSCDSSRISGEVNDERPTFFDVVSWPNPAKNNFNIRLTTPDDLNSVDIQVLDITGKRVHNGTFNWNDNYQFGDNLNSGVYFVKIVQANNARVLRVIKQ